MGNEEFLDDFELYIEEAKFKEFATVQIWTCREGCGVYRTFHHSPHKDLLACQKCYREKHGGVDGCLKEGKKC